MRRGEHLPRCNQGAGAQSSSGCPRDHIDAADRRPRPLGGRDLRAVILRAENTGRMPSRGRELGESAVAFRRAQGVKLQNDGHCRQRPPAVPPLSMCHLFTSSSVGKSNSPRYCTEEKPGPAHWRKLAEASYPMTFQRLTLIELNRRYWHWAPSPPSLNKLEDCCGAPCWRSTPSIGWPPVVGRGVS
jgi:hypothetical protein